MQTIYHRSHFAGGGANPTRNQRGRSPPLEIPSKASMLQAEWSSSNKRFDFLEKLLRHHLGDPIQHSLADAGY